MKLITRKIENEVPKLYSQENNENPTCSLKFFTPWTNWTWYVIEGEKQENGDWMFFGKVVSNLCPEGELGYFQLSELKSIKGQFGLKIERDLYFNPKVLSECK